MAVRVDRRGFLAGAAGAAVTASLAFPAIAQPKPVRIGLLPVETRPPAAGGVPARAGRRGGGGGEPSMAMHPLTSKTTPPPRPGEGGVGLFSPHTGGNPAGTK